MLLTFGCNDDFKMELPLAVDQNKLSFQSSEGATRVLVYSTSKWTATLDEDVTWATITDGSGKGTGQFIFTYEHNEGIAREAIVHIEANNGEKHDISMIQEGILTDISLKLAKEKVELIRSAGTVSVGLLTNLGVCLDAIKYSVEYPDETKWIDNVRYTSNSLIFDVDENTTNNDRFANLTLSVKDLINDKVYTTSILVSQSNEAPMLHFTETSYDVSAYSVTNTIPFESNIGELFLSIVPTVEYVGSDNNWITNFEMQNGAVKFDAIKKTTDDVRQASVILTFTEKSGNSVSTKINVIQKESIKETTFSDIRSKLSSAGSVVLGNEYIVGQIISDPSSQNMEGGKNTAYATIDFSDNNKTAYLQSLDGKYGFRIQCASEEDNIFERYSTIGLALAGAELIREENPTRYTIKNVTRGCLVSNTSGTEGSITVKSKHMKDLTDDDIYTYVTLNDVEINLNTTSYAAYTNVHDGYFIKTSTNTSGRSNPIADAIPVTLRDIQGSEINMLINSKVDWRCSKTKNVPLGSGDVKGILVHATESHFGINGNIGTYQIRPVSESDIAIAEDANNSFSQNIVVWDWYETLNKEYGTTTAPMSAYVDSENRLIPLSGNGYITSSNPTTVLATTGFNGLGPSAGIANKCMRYYMNWWNFEKNEGEWVDIHFSTKGYTTSNLTLAFNMGLGNQGATSVFIPTYWNILYSTDGKNFTKVKTIGCHQVAINASRGYFVVPGLMEYAISLPDELLNKDEVVVRIQAADTRCATYTGSESNPGQEDNGTLNATNIVQLYVRFSTIMIKCNK